MRIPKQSDESIADMLAEAEHERCDAPIETRTYYVAAITRSGRSTNAMHISEIIDFEQDDMGEPEKEDSIDEALRKHQFRRVRLLKEHPNYRKAFDYYCWITSTSCKRRLVKSQCQYHR